MADAIAAEAQCWPADVIVIATPRRRRFRRLLLGSLAEDVVRAATKLLIRGAVGKPRWARRWPIGLGFG